jgi:hypothetical protein
MRGENPLVQAYLGTLENRSDRHRELLAAIVALKQALAVGFAFKPRRVE